MMQLKELLGTNWKLKTQDDIISEEDLNSLPISIKKDMLEKEVIYKIELDGFTYYELAAPSDIKEKNLFDIASNDSSSSTYRENSYANPKKKTIILAILGNILILILKIALYVVSFVIMIFSVLFGVMGGIVSLLCGLAVSVISVGTIILFFIPSFDKLSLLLIVIPLTPFVLGVLLGEQLPIIMGEFSSWLNFQASMLKWL